MLPDGDATARLRREEYAALRATIRERGTIRLLLPVASIGAWALVSLLSVIPPAGAGYRVIPLLVLMAGFESVAALYLNVERVGRYLQVFFEERYQSVDLAAPEWETVSMSFGRHFPAAGTDPLFSWTFITATIVNAAFVARESPPTAAAIVVGLLHVLLVVRVMMERRRASRQRAEDLERFRRIARERLTQREGPQGPREVPQSAS